MMQAFETEWRARFERFARTHAGEAAIAGWSEEGLRRRLVAFTALLASLGLPAKSRVLDLGCGAGTYVRLLQALGHHAVGLDYSLPSLERAVGVDPVGAGRYLAGEAYRVPFRAESFDLVVSIGVLQALADPERALDEMRRVLRPGGALIVEALNGRAAPALLRRAREIARRQPARVRAYDPGLVERWLSARDLDLVRRAAIYLPPRGVPALARVLDAPAVQGGLERHPALACVVAHGFLFAVCRRQHDTEVTR